MSVKRLIYISAWDFTDVESDGVCKKILSQIKVFRKAGFTVDYTYIKDGSTWINKDEKETLLGYNYHLSKFAAHRLIAKYLKKHDDYKYVYVRYNKADPYFISIVKTLKGYGAKIVVEIPTYPYDNECKGCIRDRAVLCVDKIYRNKIQKYIDSFASYSADKTIFGAPSIRIINGIDFDNIRPINPPLKKDDTINLIGVACFTPSHGYDRLIKSLGEYYAGGGKRNVIFHIVGYGELEKEYKQLTEQYHVKDHVAFHGRKYGEELDKLYDEMNIGVCSLASYRVDNSMISSELKSREYAARGIPMITGVKIDAFPHDRYRFVYEVANNSTYIDIDAVTVFYDKVCSGNSILVRDEIREYALKYCNIESTMQPVIEWFAK